MVLKIATGNFKGMTLASSDTAKELRPTQALVREAIINTLSSMFLSREQAFEDLHVLDLYSGSGSMGFEFLSNGVAAISFVERDPKCKSLLRRNSEKMKTDSQIKIVSGVLPKILKSTQFSRESFDLVFFDPPFKFTIDEFLLTVKAVLEQQLLKSGALLILEYRDIELANALEQQFTEDLVLLKTKKYGGCIVIFAEKK
ncbi:MAG: RsmD family RNA methyltransferase [Cyanobacteria bacterium]|nr:RsmD family RNA methyltransferase [Cyanobacteriota bacterium]MDA1021359.1 RsmD family RNA methyltransferase [Cyanobacteriota bacterium]